MMKVFILLFLLIINISCNKEESVGGLIGNYTQGEDSKVIVSSVDIYDNSGFASPLTIPFKIYENGEATQMRITLNELCAEKSFIPFEQDNVITLAPNVKNKIYLQLKDTKEKRTKCFEYEIIHDNLPPNLPTTLNANYTNKMTETSKFTWSSASDNGPAGLPSSKYQIALSTSPSPNDIFAGPISKSTTNHTFTSLNLVLNQNYYTLLKVTDKAKNETSYKVSAPWRVYLPPPKVQNVNLVSLGHDFIEIAWDNITDDLGTGSAPEYQVSYKKSSDGAYTDLPLTDNTTFNLKISNLAPDTQYDFIVKAYNGHEYGEESDVFSDTTKRVYKLINVGGGTTGRVATLVDNNDFFHPGGAPLGTLTLLNTTNLGATAPFEILEALYPFSISGVVGSGSPAKEENAHITWMSEEYGGVNFFYSFNNQDVDITTVIFSIYATSEGDADVTINGVGFPTITKNNGIDLPFTDKINYSISSTSKILIYVKEIGGGKIVNQKPLFETSSEYIGIPYNQTTISSNLDIDYLEEYSSGSSSSKSIDQLLSDTNPVDEECGAFPLPCAYEEAEAALVKSTDGDFYIGSFNAGGGFGGTSFVPTNLMKKEFVLNADASEVVFVSKTPALISINGGGSITLTGSGPYKGVSPIHVAGTTFQSNDSFQVFYIPAQDQDQGEGDETPLLGFD